MILGKIGINVGDDVRLAVIDVGREHPLVWTEQLMPVLPVVRVANVDQAIDWALLAEGGRRHTASMHSRNIDKLSRMARLINCSIFIKNGPCYSGLGEGGEGFSSFTIASPTGEGLTGPQSFSRRRRCVPSMSQSSMSQSSASILSRLGIGRSWRGPWRTNEKESKTAGRQCHCVRSSRAVGSRCRDSGATGERCH